MDGSTRTREARQLAESALVTVADRYGAVPPFVLLGGLVPALLCRTSNVPHAGTTDIDVHVDLEAQTLLTDAMPRLEQALLQSGFTVDASHAWRWFTRTTSGVRAEVKFELLTDSEVDPANATIQFDSCAHLGAANLRGTRFASMDYQVMELGVRVDGIELVKRVNIAGVSGFLLAKLAAACSRGLPKDWYDLAYVLIHNDFGRPAAVAALVKETFPDVHENEARTWLLELQANFGSSDSQGTEAYVNQMLLDQPHESPQVLGTDARLAVAEFCRELS